MLVNISSRLRVQSGDDVLIGGFIINGSTPKRVLVRAIGPSVRVDGTLVQGRLEDPTLELLDRNGTRIAFNDNWRDSEDREDIESSGLAPEDDRESVITRTLDPEAYTAIMRGQNDSSGIGLVEVFDREGGSAAELANISTRGLVQTDDNVLIGGFILGAQPGGTRVLIRAIGPSLKGQLPQALDDPELEVFDGNGGRIAGNDNWRDSDRRDEIDGTGIAPSNDAESAVLLDAAPANYTAIVRGKDRSTGIGLVEVFNVK